MATSTLRCSILFPASNKKNVTIQVADPCRLRRARRREVIWGHLGAEPRSPRQEDCVPLHPLLNSYKKQEGIQDFMDTLKREVLSERVRLVKPSGIRKFFDIINTMPDVISLGVGEPDFVTPAHIRQAGIESIQQGRTRYTSNFGILALREEIAAMLQRRYGLVSDQTT